MRAPTIHDVAASARVSVGTVSNVLNRPQKVAPATLERVQAAIDELGFVRNDSARQLNGARSTTIGLVVLDVTNPFYTEVARGVEDAVLEEGYLVILCNSAGSPVREDRYLRALGEQRVEGVLITPARSAEPPALRRLRDGGASVVLLDRRSRRKDHSSVSVDDEAGGRLAGAHLVERGHRRIGLISSGSSIQQIAERRTGLCSSLAAFGLSLAPGHEIVPEEDIGVLGGEAATGQLLDGRNPPTAVFCGSDLLAVGALRAAIARGLRVPEDLAIVGYDDIAFAASSSVPLTTIRQPMYELGHRAAKLMLAEARDPGRPRERFVFQPELVVRDSTVGREGAAAQVAAAR